MRRGKKREILQSIHMLKNAHRKLRAVPCGSGNELLAQCQELAIAVGETIERFDPMSSITIGHLEELCELLYKGYVCENRNEYPLIMKEIGNSLKTIEKSAVEDIENSPYEIVFLPYKASMWDTFDTVYRAAKKDEDCHVTVMPVPYYNMNQKKHQIEIHYEGDLFPPDIPIMDYNVCSLEELCPDVIFIHNPYDQYNYVTRLPESYFSTNLVRITEHLVYIPYFITRGIDVKEQYCTMPAVQNAWRTFVQSEKVRKCYIKYGADPSKIVTMGSPKFDMVIKMHKNPPKMPKDWKAACSGRKVFLLNTHLNSIITEAEKMIDKLHNTFSLFKGREGVALLWRPHPLSIETAKAMNPRMLDRYLKLIEEFKTLDNGIYDDTPDVHRAIAVSDAYIGDWSSMVPLYGITGKPMYITNIKIETHVEKKKFCFSCAAELDGYLWVPSDEINGLFQICENTGECNFITAFYKEKLYATFLYNGIVAFKRKLFLVPNNAEYIVEYEVDTGRTKYYDIYGGERKSYLKFCRYEVDGSRLYLFPFELRDIVCLNMESGELRQYSWNFGILPKDVIDSRYSKFFRGTKVGRTEFLPCALRNLLIKIDLDDYHSQAIEVSGSETGFIDSAYDRGVLYLMNLKGDIFTYSLETGNIGLMLENCELEEGIPYPYGRLLIHDGCLWQIPAYAKYIRKIDIITKEKSDVNLYPEDFKIEEFPGIYPWKWMNGEVKNRSLILYPFKSNMMLRWEEEKDLPQGIRIKEPINEAWIEYRMLKCEEGYLYYEHYFSIDCFLNIITSDLDKYDALRSQYFKGFQCNIDGTCAEHIWRYVKHSL